MSEIKKTSPLVPSSSSLYLGIDLGTSGVRAIAIDARRQPVGEAKTPLAESSQQNGFHEQDPHQWWRAVNTVLSKLGQQIQFENVQAIAVDGTSGTVLLSDPQGDPIGPALMYNDQRAGEQAEQLQAITPPGSPVIAPTSGLAKLMWLQQHSKADNIHHYLHQADWVAGKLAGQFGFSDSNNALKSGYDPLNARWPAWLADLPIEQSALPRVYPAGHVVANLAPAIAKQFGFHDESKIVSGTTDSTASFLATGAKQVGEAVTALGSTLVLKVISEQPVENTQYGIYSQPLGQQWLVGGASNSGGKVLRQFFEDESMTRLQTQINPDKPTGYDYYPLPIAGERFPINDASLAPRIAPRPDDEVEFFQALLEGIAAIEKLGYERLAECGAPWPSSIRTTGGGAMNPAWTAIRARLLNLPIIAAEHTEAAYGSALLAYNAVKTVVRD